MGGRVVLIGHTENAYTFLMENLTVCRWEDNIVAYLLKAKNCGARETAVASERL
jgi:hypothetical protein